jgi:signal transduction histidine kinase
MGDDQGRIVMWVGSNTDIHEQRETANRLRQLANDLQDVDRRKDEFLAMLAHELRNPLAPISNALHIVRRHGDNAKTVQSALEIMERQVAQMIRLVDDLVDVSRMSSGKIGLRRERVELLSVVKHLAEATQSLAAKSNHELAVALPAEPIYVNADATRLSQALGNLLNNACKYTPAGGRIAVAVERVGVHAVVRVSDTGIGIAPENLPRIFEMFTQVDTSLERSQSGLGIGLTLARKLLEMHEGTLEARSAGVGKGSEFVVRLPVDLDAGQAMRSEADASRVGVADIIESSARGGSLRPVRQAH